MRRWPFPLCQSDWHVRRICGRDQPDARDSGWTAAPRRRASRTASASAALAVSSLARASLYTRAASLTASSPSLFTPHLLTVRDVPYQTGLAWGLGRGQGRKLG